MKTNSLFKRLVSMLIVVLMICTLFPVTALAEDYDVDNFDLLPTYTYTIEYDTQGGSFVDSTTVLSKSIVYPMSVTDKRPSKDGFIFLGWATESNATAPNVLLSYYTLYSSNPTVTLYAVWRDSTPSLDELNYILDVKISCLNATLGDPEWFHTLIGGTYTIGEVTGNEADGYTCTVTVNSAKYIQQYSDSRNPKTDHELAENEDPSKTVTLEYENGVWCVKDSYFAVIEFKVVHEKTYTLSYDTKGGTGTFTAQQQTVNVGQPATFTIYSTKPTKDGYEFKGWATKDNATVAEYQPGDKITIKANPTLFAVWEKDPVTYTLTYDANGGNGAPSAQSDKSTADNFTFTISATVPTRGGYTFKGWAETANATAANVGSSYTLSSSDPSKTLYAVWEKNAPTYDELNRLFGNSAVTILCTNTEAKHNPATYGLLPNSENENDSYSISKPQKDEKTGLYTCNITVTRDKYIAKYNETNVGHTAVATDLRSKDITLEYIDGAWTVKSGSAPVVFYVECESPAPAPKQPVATDLPQILWSEAVKIDCVNGDVEHADATYGLIANSFTIGEVTAVATGGYTCEVTVEPALYVAAYNAYIGVDHELDPATQSAKKITLEYVATSGKWQVKQGSAPVTFTVKCVTPDPAPKQPVATDLPEILWKEAVKIDCVNDKVTHIDKIYGLIDGSYTIGEVSGDANGYTCNVTVNPDLYIAEYNKYIGVEHKLVLRDQGSQTITLVYNENTKKWDVGQNSVPVIFNVMCVTPVTTYTVTYTDGVDGVEIFKDDVHTGIRAGEPTPMFSGSLVRKGYVFTGWTPAVSGRVNGNATYVATWKKVPDNYRDTTVIEIGGGNSSSSSSKEENPNTGAPVFVGVSVGALAAAK